MNNGIIEQIASPNEIYEKPNNLFVADFIGCPAINLLKGTATEKKTIKLKIGDQVIQVPEWASESTMDNLLRYARAEHKVTKAFGDEIKKFDQVENQLLRRRRRQTRPTTKRTAFSSA